MDRCVTRSYETWETGLSNSLPCGRSADIAAAKTDRWRDGEVERVAMAEKRVETCRPRCAVQTRPSEATRPRVEL